MANDDDPYHPDRMAHIAPAGLGWGHTRGSDPRTPEEKAEAQRKENARRKGSGRKGWWKKYPPTDLR